MLLAIAMFHAQISWSKATPEETQRGRAQDGHCRCAARHTFLSGPGAISTVIIFADQSPTWEHKGLLVASCVMVALAVWVTLRLAIPIGAMLGKTGINIVTRLMGLLLSAIAVEIIAGGLGKLLPGFVRDKFADCRCRFLVFS